MRFFDTVDDPLALSEIEKALHAEDELYRINAKEKALYYGEEKIGVLSITTPQEKLFATEIGEILGELAAVAGEAEDKEWIKQVLESTRRTIVVEVDFGQRDVEETMNGLDPLWGWLFENREGLLYVSGEGFYDCQDLVLALE
jgi:hypothetical protein